MRAHARHPAQAPAPRSITAPAPRAAEPGTEGSALQGMAQRANAGPHAASLAALGAVVAQRACAGCDAVKRARREPAQRTSGSGWTTAMEEAALEGDEL